MSMLSEQLSAVFAAPIPFAIALVPLGVAKWGAFEWSYRSVLNKRKELFRTFTVGGGVLERPCGANRKSCDSTTKQVKELTADLRKEARNQVGHIGSYVQLLRY
jgi:hypothetical protein